jgi:hypothetical protein
LGEKDWFLIAKIQKTAHPHKQKPEKLEKLDELDELEGLEKMVALVQK